MKWAQKLAKDTTENFARFNTTNPYMTNQEGKRSFQERLNNSQESNLLAQSQQYNLGASSSRKTLSPIEELNESLTIIPTDLQKTACRAIFKKIQEAIDSKILMNIPATPVFKVRDNQSAGHPQTLTSVRY